MKFKGNINELKDALLLGGVDGFWEDAENRFVLKSYNGAVINFYPTTGSILIQGKKVPKEELEAKV